jgi:lysine 6-dehydrogenase
MKVLVLGGAGIVGRAVTKDLASQPDVVKVTIGDVNVNASEKYLEALNSKKVSFEQVDVADHEKLVKTMKRFDVIANCVYWSMLFQIAKASIEAKVHIVDMGGMYYGTMKLMELDGEAKKAGTTILHGCGSSPGITNVLARYAANKLDRVDEIHILGGGPVPSPGGPPLKGGRATIRTILDELTFNPIVYDHGEYKKVPAISGREQVRFSDPVGLQTLYYCIHTETLTLSKYIKDVRIVDVKGEFNDEIVSKASNLADLGLTTQDPIDFHGYSIIPRQFLDSLLVAKQLEEGVEGSEIWMTMVRIKGEKNREPVMLTYEIKAEYEKRWGNKKSGTPCAVGVLMLGRGEVSSRGFTVPEECIDPHKFIQENKNRGIIFTEKEEWIRNV